MIKKIFVCLCAVFGLSSSVVYADELDDLINDCQKLTACQISVRPRNHMKKVGVVLTDAEKGNIEGRMSADVYKDMIETNLKKENDQVREIVQAILKHRNNLIRDGKAKEAYEAMLRFTTTSVSPAKKHLESFFEGVKRRNDRLQCDAHDLGRLYAKCLIAKAENQDVWSVYGTFSATLK